MRPMLDVAWAPMLGAFSVLFEEFSEGDGGAHPMLNFRRVQPCWRLSSTALTVRMCAVLARVSCCLSLALASAQRGSGARLLIAVVRLAV